VAKKQTAEVVGSMWQQGIAANVFYQYGSATTSLSLE
jgi:hypothetical protein